jgi:sugar lactone lactonase YvrE
MRPCRLPATLVAATLLAIAIVPSVTAQAMPDNWNWTYYRPTNTGIQGDNAYAVWLDAAGDPYIAAYNPIWEEGGFARFIQSENRWENFSNVDYPVMGSPDMSGSVRIHEVIEYGDGTLWMLVWSGLISYHPGIGASSLKRVDATNSPLPPGTTRDMDLAPDGTLWIASDGGGLARFNPASESWTVWNANPGPDGWPGWIGLEKLNVQPVGGGDYLVWLEEFFWGRLVYSSATGTFSPVSDGQPGDIAEVVRDAVDDQGNAWMLRELSGSTAYSLDYRRPDGTWVVPPQPHDAIYGAPKFRAFGDGQALMVGAGNTVLHFDGAAWRDLGVWPGGTGYIGSMAMDAAGNVWAVGIGGAGVRDAATGAWKRYRVTNTSQIDMFVRDLAFDTESNVWVTGNAAPGFGGIGRFDGQRWYNFNVATYGLGGDWPYPCDNADAIVYRPSTGRIAFNPYSNGIREWDGAEFSTIEEFSQIDGLTEDSLGRLWVIGNYFSLRYHDGDGFHDVPILGWGWNIVTDPSRPGTVWACANGEVVRTDGDYRFSRANTELPELSPVSDVLTTVAVAPDGTAWLGSTQGLFHIDPETGAHQWWHSSNSAMPGDQVQPLAVTPDGRVWFTNFNSFGIEASLVWFDGEQFGTVTVADGLPHAQIYDAEVRDLGDAYELWISCASRGIAVLTVPLDQTTGVDPAVPVAVRLGGHPNPFNPRTTLSFDLPADGAVDLDIFDARGRLVRRLIDGAPRVAGAHRVAWDGRDDTGRTLPAGVYLAQLRGAGAATTVKLTLAK